MRYEIPTQKVRIKGCSAFPVSHSHIKLWSSKTVIWFFLSWLVSTFKANLPSKQDAFIFISIIMSSTSPRSHCQTCLLTNIGLCWSLPPLASRWRHDCVCWPMYLSVPKHFWTPKSLSEIYWSQYSIKAGGKSWAKMDALFLFCLNLIRLRQYFQTCVSAEEAFTLCIQQLWLQNSAH